MVDGLTISGFADEICADFDEQLRTVTDLGMNHICLRAADGKGIASYTVDEVQKLLLPRLRARGVNVSSLGSPIGKIDLTDDTAFDRQLAQLETLCQICELLGSRYVRVFSFYVPADQPPGAFADAVVARMGQFAEIAQRYGVILIHENEKGIFGDSASRCRTLLDTVNSGHFKAAFDFANFVQCGEDPIECWMQLREHVVYFHIKDAVRTTEANVLCGTGDGHIADILKSAIANGYRGFLTLEPHLAKFDTFKSLERSTTVSSPQPIDRPRRLEGPGAYAAQYHALLAILDAIAQEPVVSPTGD